MYVFVAFPPKKENQKNISVTHRGSTAEVFAAIPQVLPLVGGESRRTSCRSAGFRECLALARDHDGDHAGSVKKTRFSRAKQTFSLYVFVCSVLFGFVFCCLESHVGTQ